MRRLFRIVFPHRGRTRGLGRVEYWLFRNSASYEQFYWDSVRGA
jgi:hypothetical protein